MVIVPYRSFWRHRIKSLCQFPLLSKSFFVTNYYPSRNSQTYYDVSHKIWLKLIRTIVLFNLILYCTIRYLPHNLQPKFHKTTPNHDPIRDPLNTNPHTPAQLSFFKGLCDVEQNGMRGMSTGETSAIWGRVNRFCCHVYFSCMEDRTMITQAPYNVFLVALSSTTSNDAQQ